MQISPPNFRAEAWEKLRPDALSKMVEIGRYLILWTIVLVAHIVRVAMAVAGVDSEVVKVVAWMEKWVFFASFADLFVRILFLAYS